MKHEKPQLPDWTPQYPEEDREFLAAWGRSPDYHPHAHELNVRLAEIGRVFERARAYIVRNPANIRWVLKDLIPSTVGGLFSSLFGDFEYPTLAEQIAELDGFSRLDGIHPRPRAEVEPSADWLTMYPAEYWPVLRKWGVPTIKGTQVDDYNRNLIDRVSPDCTDDATLEQAAYQAMVAAFSHNCIPQPADHKDAPPIASEHSAAAVIVDVSAPPPAPNTGVVSVPDRHNRDENATKLETAPTLLANSDDEEKGKTVEKGTYDWPLDVVSDVVGAEQIERVKPAFDRDLALLLPCESLNDTHHAVEMLLRLHLGVALVPSFTTSPDVSAHLEQRMRYLLEVAGAPHAPLEPLLAQEVNRVYEHIERHHPAQAEKYRTNRPAFERDIAFLVGAAQSMEEIVLSFHMLLIAHFNVTVFNKEQVERARYAPRSAEFIRRTGYLGDMLEDKLRRRRRASLN